MESKRKEKRESGEEEKVMVGQVLLKNEIEGVYGKGREEGSNERVVVNLK